MKEINEHNAKEGETYTMAENHFSDLTDEEFKSMYLKTIPISNKVEDEEPFYSEEFNGEVNWVTQGKVQKVKNQGSCGGCWAFSTVGAVESASAIFANKLGDFSEQQLIDCDTGS